MVYEQTRIETPQGRVLSDKWQFRLNFFDTHGVPGWGRPSPEYAAALKALSFRDRLKITMNLWGAFFGFVYLLYLGLWRKAIVVFVGWIVLGGLTVALDLPEGIGSAVGSGLGAAWWVLVGVRVNIYYYERVMKGRQTWGL